MDKFAQCVGGLMVLLTIYIAFTSHPPPGTGHFQDRNAGYHRRDMSRPLQGAGRLYYLAGGHRSLDADFRVGKYGPGKPRLSHGHWYYQLDADFAVPSYWGVIAQGFTLILPTRALFFQLAAGDEEYKIFGIVMVSRHYFCSGLCYTSVSFIRTFSPTFGKNTIAT